MGEGTKRRFRFQPVDDDGPDFGDPPRNWGRVVSMAGVWTVVLLGGAWIAPGFASGGSSAATDVRDQPATDEINAASRYLRFGSDDDVDRAEQVLCDGASPGVKPADLVELRAFYEEELGSYPETEVKTELPEMTAQGAEVDATISYIAGNSFREESFSVTVKESDGDFCVTQAVRHEQEQDEPGSAGDPQELAARYLSAVFVARNIEAAAGHQCREYEGVEPRELSDALSDWEVLFGEASAIQSFDGDPVTSTGSTVVPMSVELSSGRAVETFSFEVTVEGDCAAALSGGEALLETSD
ncbi:hypothetical protein L0U85_00560 [Glycomyces sp. L485]|uniref:hypothetical protein n=1 Tax=Glycomyces sp. L485 TaxID=2909235 RepID=UPI001F4B9C37|nr:hypothetical protein [Glycomyces sp. L485]MCH7229360.1 hypothetical protein [Glycomyces sp. L485]